MSIEFLIALMVVSGILLGTGAVKVPMLRKKMATASTTTTAGAASVPAPKQPGYLSKVRGSMNPVTFFGILVFAAILIIFMLIPGDLVAYIGTIMMTILMIMIILSVVMWMTNWGNRWVWFALLFGFVWLSYNPPETTAQRVAQGYESVTTEGLKGVAPSVTPLVPNFIYTSPEEKAAARKAEADELKHQQELARIKAEGEARARVSSEAAAARELEATMRDAKAVPCIRKYTDKSKYVNCTTVTFGYNTKYERTDAIDHCAVIDPKNAVTEVNLGGNQWQYTGPSGLVVQFFDVPLGKLLPSGKKCGE